MDFTNTEIKKEQLPQIDSINFRLLNKNLLHIMRINIIVFTLIIITVLSIYNYITEEITINIQLYIISTILFLAITKIVYSAVSYNYRGYALREKDISYKKGYIFRSITTIPFNRIQHTEIKESAISRLFSLQTVKFYTAGGATSDLQIAGLSKDDAQRIKEFINGKIKNYED